MCCLPLKDHQRVCLPSIIEGGSQSAGVGLSPTFFGQKQCKKTFFLCFTTHWSHDCPFKYQMEQIENSRYCVSYNDYIEVQHGRFQTLRKFLETQKVPDTQKHGRFQTLRNTEGYRRLETRKSDLTPPRHGQYKFFNCLSLSEVMASGTAELTCHQLGQATLGPDSTWMGDRLGTPGAVFRAMMMYHHCHKCSWFSWGSLPSKRPPVRGPSYKLVRWSEPIFCHFLGQKRPKNGIFSTFRNTLL